MATPRQRIWGWYFFDWASQPYNTLLLTFIFGPYFAEVARGYYMGAGLEAEAAKAAAQAYWGWGLAIASVCVAILAPILGAIAERNYPLLQATILLVTTGFVVVNFLVDLLYVAIDPRVRL